MTIFFLFIVIYTAYIKYKITKFYSCHIVAIILPVTSNGNRIDKQNPDPSQMLLMKYFYPSFLSTIEPLLYEYRIYLGYAFNDYYLSNYAFLNKLKAIMKNKFFKVYFIFY